MKDLVRAPTREFQRQRAGTSGSARRAARARRPRLAREDVGARGDGVGVRDGAPVLGLDDGVEARDAG